jgi:hypothetical protein
MTWQVRRLEAERAELATALARRNAYLQATREVLQREHAHEMAAAVAKHESEASDLRTALGVSQRHLRYALSGLPSSRSAARQALYYESQLKRPMPPDAPPSTSWRGAHETLDWQSQEALHVAALRTAET